jgi:hypothetical protein
LVLYGNPDYDTLLDEKRWIVDTNSVRSAAGIKLVVDAIYTGKVDAPPHALLEILPVFYQLNCCFFLDDCCALLSMRADKTCILPLLATAMRVNGKWREFLQHLALELFKKEFKKNRSIKRCLLRLSMCPNLIKSKV